MDTLHRPEIRKPTIHLREIVANALLVVGFVLMVLGIYEIGGLFNIGLGFLVLWAGALVAMADMTRRYRNDEEAFLRITDDF